MRRQPDSERLLEEGTLFAEQAISWLLAKLEQHGVSFRQVFSNSCTIISGQIRCQTRSLLWALLCPSQQYGTADERPCLPYVSRGSIDKENVSFVLPQVVL